MERDIKILIADDSSFMRKVLKDILLKEGYTNFIEAGNGIEALEKYEEEKPDLVLLDIIMPEMDGIEVLKKIGQEAKILVISAVGQEEMIKESKKLGSLGFITKPFDNSNVTKEINKVLN